jgi:hypothetical protein
MMDSNEWAEQQYIAHEAMNQLTALRDKFEEVGEVKGIDAKELTMMLSTFDCMVDIIGSQYGLEKEKFLETDMDDYVEFIVNEGNA